MRSEASVLDYLIQVLAFTMESHLDALAAVEAEVARLDAGQADRSPLARALERLRELRSALRERFTQLNSYIEEAPTSYLDDAYALVGYYLEAGARGELRALERASRYADVRADEGEVEELVALGRVILSRLSARLGE
ncbi:MAG: hypothetical protein LRS49_02200 [Desulfurococcales archaeon]|nr:hypothetical protein [Desulfurococcales archaeon]